MAVEDLIKYNTDYDVARELLHTLIIGNNGAGEFIAIKHLGFNNYRLVLSPFIDMDEKDHIEIGSSFIDMLTRLDNGTEWFT